MCTCVSAGHFSPAQRGSASPTPNISEFHVGAEYSSAIFAGEIFWQRVCMCLTILPVGHPEWEDSKRKTHQYSCDFMLSLMLQEIVSDQVSVRVICVCLCVSEGARDGENKVMIRSARDGLTSSQADEKETGGGDHTDEKRG